MNRWLGRALIGGITVLVLGYTGVRYALSDPALRPRLKRLYLATRLHGNDNPRTEDPLERAESPLLIYQDGLASGWADWSWASRKIQDPARTRSGKYALSMILKGYEGIYLSHLPFSIAGYGNLEFWIWMPSGVEKQLAVCIAGEDRKLAPGLPLENYLSLVTSDGWRKASVPLTKFGLQREDDSISGVGFQALNGTNTTVYIDDIQLTVDKNLPKAPVAETIMVTVDVNQSNRPISPLIYGMSVATGEEAHRYRLGLNRWGGNPNTRYNWVAESWNAARDWHFTNYGWENGASKSAGAKADAFVAANKAAGTATLFTIPTIGWVAKDGNRATKSLDVPKTGGLPLRDFTGSIAGYDPSANRNRTSVRSQARKGSPFILSPTPSPDGNYTVYQDEFVHHLTKRFGDAQHGGVRFYAMDNEPDLWAQTHTDVQPVLPGYDDLLQRFYEYATAVKDVDPGALVTGPVSWGWAGYLTSPKDLDNFAGRPDRRAHGDEFFIPWFLKSVRSRDKVAGRRTLDVLDIHYYPQGDVFSDKIGASMRRLRLRSTRSLWDPNYRDESWINDTVELVPRMKRWVAENYPGTKLGITEWNFGAEQDISGGLAVVEVLGIYGREGVDLANYWTRPKPGSPAALGFALYRNPDGNAKAQFGDISCQAISPSPDRLSCFAAKDSMSGAVTLVLVNKTAHTTITVPLSVSGATRMAGHELYSFSAASAGRISKTTNAPLKEGRATIILPPYSATLAVFSKGTGTK